jgi:hypothetical protein
MNRNALACVSASQKFSACVDLEFRPEVVKATGVGQNYCELIVEKYNQAVKKSRVISQV